MILSRLEVVNACLASMGESPVNSVNESSPFIASALNAMESAHANEQSLGWFFNLERITINPTEDGEYYVPADCLGLSTDKTPNYITIRGRRLYDRSQGEYLTGTKPLVVHIIRNVPFDDLPYHARRLVKAATVVEFQKSYDGDEIKIRDAEREYDIARQYLMAEHTRNVRANMIYHGNTGANLNSIYNHYARLPTRG